MHRALQTPNHAQVMQMRPLLLTKQYRVTGAACPMQVSSANDTTSDGPQSAFITYVCDYIYISGLI